MRKAILLFFLAITLFSFGQQANLYTIPNQSAQFIRMPSRNATTETDAVFFNGAALATTNNGFYFTINNQILNQITEVKSDYEFYTNGETTYPGRVTGFVFPSVFLNYKINKASFHGGFFLVGGAGGVEYDNLPISDRGIADIPAALGYAPVIGLVALDASIEANTGSNPMYSNITDYRFNFQNKGLGYSPAFQGGMSYQLNKYFSFGVDVRYVSQRVQSQGFTTDIEINVESNDPTVNGWQSAGDYLRSIGDVTGDPFYGITAGIYDGLGGDRFIDIQQNGSGVIPIASVFVSPTDKLNIGLKYEPRTNITLKTKVIEGKDGGELGGRPVFIDGEKIRSDLPGFVSGGLTYQIFDKWMVATGGRLMFAKKANFNGREAFIEKNYFEVELATEYQIVEKFLVSGGYTFNRPAVAKEYLNDVDFWLPGHTFGLGAKIDFSKNIAFNFGAMLTLFNSRSETYDHLFADGNELAVPPPTYVGTYTMKYKKSAYIFGLGLDFNFPNGKDKTQFIDDAAVNSADAPYQFRTL